MSKLSTYIGTIAVLFLSFELQGETEDRKLEEMFEAGRKLASRVVQQVTRCKIALNADRDFYDSLTSLGSVLGADIIASPFAWPESWPQNYTQNSCAWTLPREKSAVHFSWQHCAGAKTSTDAAEIILHEAFHHMGVTDETQARQNANRIFRDAKSGVCGAILPSQTEPSQNPAPQSTPKYLDNAYAAVAINLRNLSVTAINDGASQEEATSTVMRYCGEPNCKLVGHVKNGCIVYAHSPFTAPGQFITTTVPMKARSTPSLAALEYELLESLSEKHFDVYVGSVCAITYDVLSKPGWWINVQGAEFIAVAGSESMEVLASSRGMRTRYDAEVNSIEECRRTSSFASDCRVIASALGQKIYATLGQFEALKYSPDGNTQSFWTPKIFVPKIIPPPYRVDDGFGSGFPLTSRWTPNIIFKLRAASRQLVETDWGSRVTP